MLLFAVNSVLFKILVECYEPTGKLLLLQLTCNLYFAYVLIIILLL